MNYNSIKNKTFSENPAVKAEYDQLGPQYEAIRAAIASRKSAGLTQKQLAEKIGTAQANISRFENGNANPSLDFLQKMASCMGKTLHQKLLKTLKKHKKKLLEYADVYADERKKSDIVYSAYTISLTTTPSAHSSLRTFLNSVRQKRIF